VAERPIVLPPVTKGRKASCDSSKAIRLTYKSHLRKFRDCRVPMWLTRVELELTNPEHEKRTFECKACGDMVRDR